MRKQRSPWIQPSEKDSSVPEPFQHLLPRQLLISFGQPLAPPASSARHPHLRIHSWDPDFKVLLAADRNGGEESSSVEFREVCGKIGSGTMERGEWMAVVVGYKGVVGVNGRSSIWVVLGDMEGRCFGIEGVGIPFELNFLGELVRVQSLLTIVVVVF
jgi:hypothetical protein